MKIILLLSGFLMPLIEYAQPVLIPYKANGKYGLCDDKANIILSPQYDNIEYLKDQYFEYRNFTAQKDSLGFVPPYPAREAVSKVTGVLYKNKLIISGQEYDDYLIYPHLIIGSSNEYHAENCMLFNLKGVQLLPEKVKAMYVNDERDIGYLGNLARQYTLLSVVDRDPQRKRIFSLAVYDNQAQQIKKWLLKNVRNYKKDEYRQSTTHILCSYEDETGTHEKCIRFVNNKLEIVEKGSLTPAELEMLASTASPNFQGYPDMLPEREPPPVPTREMMQPDAPLNPADYTEKQQEEMGYLYYQFTNDSLFFIRPAGKQFVVVPPGTELIFTAKKVYSQRGALLFKQNKKYGLIIKGVVGAALYDSLFYFGNDFIAYQTIQQQVKCGLINKEGLIIVPLQYDSIPGGMPKFRFDDYRINNKREETFVLYQDIGYEERMQKNPFVKKEATTVLVYNNGKAGLIDRENNLLMPVVYDLIAENGMNFLRPNISNFIVMKKNGQYGLAQLQYDYDKKRFAIGDSVPPFLPGIPCYMKNDYYEKKGFRLIGLYDEHFTFLGFANEKGVLYFKQ